MSKLFAVILGLAGGVLGSQAPAFTLQYMQNLTGRIAELRPIVEEFEANVAQYGYTRETAMAECASASGLLDALCSTYESAVERYASLSIHYAELQEAGEYMRPVTLARTQLPDITQSVYEEFKPAVPTTADGAAYAGGGAAGVWGFVQGLLSLFGIGGGRKHYYR